MKGLIFAVEEMAVHDGPGLRTAVFLKGCPLRCRWCHNPEGWEMRARRVKSPNGCLHCGACDLPCAENCLGCGGCLARCPRGLLRVSGQWWSPDALAAKIHESDAILSDGGVTLSGGEPLMQPAFLLALLDALAPLHRAIETSGYGDSAAWTAALQRLEWVYFDVKTVDPERHKLYTGADNAPILRNLEILKKSGVPFVVRVPCMKGVNDDDANLEATCRLIAGAPNLLGAEILPYNACAGAKYPLAGLTYAYDFEKPDAERLDAAKRIFARAGVPLTIR